MPLSTGLDLVSQKVVHIYYFSQLRKNQNQKVILTNEGKSNRKLPKYICW